MFAVSVFSLGMVGLVAATGLVLALAVLSARLYARLDAQVQAVRASEERYRLLFNRSLAGVYQSTLEGIGKGTGQGLAIARSVIVDKHGGEMTFDSKPGVGTTFYLRLPIGGPVTAAAA